MAGIKKKCRELNRAKNVFLKWLEDRGGTHVEVFEGDYDSEWDYYRHASGFLGDDLVVCYFMMWHDRVTIEWRSDNRDSYEFTSVEDFLNFLN